MNAKSAKGALMNENISFANEHRNELFLLLFFAEKKSKSFRQAQ